MWMPASGPHLKECPARALWGQLAMAPAEDIGCKFQMSISSCLCSVSNYTVTSTVLTLDPVTCITQILILGIHSKLNT